MPQGLLKKIEIDLLLADLPLKLRDPTLRFRQRVGRRHRFGGEPFACCRLFTARRPHRQNLGLGRSTTTAQRNRASQPKPFTPLVEILPPHPQLARQRAYVLPRKHPPNRRNLKLAAEPSRLFL